MPRWAPSTRWVLSAVACATMATVAIGCDDAKEQPSAETLPPLQLTDTTPNLLLTWIDERGDTHTGVSIGEVPPSSRSMVRVIQEQRGHGSVFYVADLTKKDAAGVYTVTTMPRTAWEAEIQRRRDAYEAQHAPPPRAAPSSGDPPPAVAGVEATIYGASWCKPCHDAAAYLRRKGVKVTEHDIEENPAKGKEMMQKLRDAGMAGGGSIPIIDVGGIILKGFSPRALDRALAKAASGSGTRL